MVTLEEAQSILKCHVKRIDDTEECGLIESLGRITGEGLAARTDQPPFPRSPLDGYAVYAQDTYGASKDGPAKLKVVGELLAGDRAVHGICPGQAVRIMTGAPLPPGADAVVRQEDTDYGEEQVRICRSVKPYKNYCFQGEDFKAGDMLIQAGETMDTARVALAACMGYDKIMVRKRPNIALLTTGSELRGPGENLKQGEVYDANRYLVEARLREWGIVPSYTGTVEDDVRKAAGCLAHLCREADLVITTGGVSVGKKDIMHEVVRRLFAARLFWRVKLKPGSPAMASLYKDTLIISLSGNPFGAAAGMELLVRPVLHHMTGDRRLKTARMPGVMEEDFPKGGGLRRFVRASVRSGKVSIPSGSHSSGALRSMKDCNCLIDIPADNQGLCKGDSVWVIRL